MAEQQKRSRWLAILIALIAIVPMGLAWWIKEHPEWIQERSNYGNLITPARPLGYGEFSLMPSNFAENLDEMKGRWVIVHVLRGQTCQDACLETLHKTRQVRLMLNKDISRVRRVLLALDEKAGWAVRNQNKGDPTLLIAQVSPRFMAQLREITGRPISDEMVFLMDPLGNLMMWYAPNFDPYGVAKDLRHLLKASQVG